ncbi:MAG TPA: cytochrome c biogenesis protein CcsA [Fluviicoccus sp.]|nr:cytochrome c biogenesis protein CcsA [Fluviicoccus sp.]
MSLMLAGLLAIGCYLGACLLLLHFLARKLPLPRPAILGLGVLALPLHGLVVMSQIFQADGLHLGLFHIISLVGWLIAAMHILFTSYRPLLALCLGAYPAAAVSLLLSLLFQSPAHLPLTHLAPGMEIHILLSILAYSVLFMAALHALLLSVQSRGLKHRSPSSSRSLLKVLPPLQTMEAVLFDMIGLGFALLTLAIVSGFLSLDNMFAQHVVHKTVFSLIAWGVFAALLGGHRLRGWRGQTAIRFTLSGFALLVLGFYGSKIVLELVLQKV